MVKRKESKAQNIVSIIVFLILSAFITYKACNYIQNIALSEQTLLEKCTFLDGSSEMANFCANIQTNGYHPSDFYYMFYEIFCNNHALYIVGLVVISSSVYSSLYYKNKKNLKEIEKGNYKELQKEMLINTYKPVLALVLAAIYAMILCYLYNKGFTYNIIVDAGYWSIKLVKHAYVFIPLFLCNLIVHGLLFSSVTYLFVRKFPNIIVSSILAYATLYVTEAVYEIVIEAIIFNNLFNLPWTSLISIFNFLTFRDNYGLFACTIVPLMTLIITYLVMYKVYHQKDKLIKDLKKEQKNPILGLKLKK